MKRQEHFLSQKVLAVVLARIAFQKPVQASIDIPLHSDLSYSTGSDTDKLK